MFYKVVLQSVLLGALFFTGCESDSNSDSYSGGSDSPIDLKKVVWLGADVSDWAETRQLVGVAFGGGLIQYQFDGPDPWPNNANGINGNAWVFINKGGVWHAVTHEYMRRGYTTRGMNTVNPKHFKNAALDGYYPRSGEAYGWMVSGLVRGGNRNVSERTNVFMAKWP
jgi:hypothetical protein